MSAARLNNVKSLLMLKENPMENIVLEEFDRLTKLEPELLEDLLSELYAYLEAPMSGYVYLMYYETGYYKLGFAKSPPSRKKQLRGAQQELDIKVEIIHIIETDDMRRLEKETAAIFNSTSKVVGNEMWNLSQEDIDMFCSFATCFYGQKGSSWIKLF